MFLKLTLWGYGLQSPPNVRDLVLHPYSTTGNIKIENEPNKSENPAVSNLLMNGWKEEEEENRTIM